MAGRLKRTRPITFVDGAVLGFCAVNARVFFCSRPMRFDFARCSEVSPWFSIPVPSTKRLWNRSAQPRARKRPIFPVACQNFTNSAQATGSENIDPERPLPDLLARGPVLSPSRITLENNGKIRPQPDRENAFARASGGGGGIRTHGGVSPSSVFKTGAFNHSATPPTRAV